MSSDWIFLSKKGQDEYINMFANGCGGKITSSDDFVYESSDAPIMLRSILRHKIMHRCWADKRTFYYMDTGYFGNKADKVWHRIVKDDLQHTGIIDRPSDRWERTRVKLHPRRHGKKIVIAMSTDKPFAFYGKNKDSWIKNTIETIKQNTDRPIVIREKNTSRSYRVNENPLSRVLEDDVHALVTFNSNSAVDSILAGVPAFISSPVHAAEPVANSDLTKIDDPYWPDSDKLLAWCHHLAYCQYHIREFRNGTAYRMLNEN